MPHDQLLSRDSSRPTTTKQHLAQRWAQRRLGRIDHELRVIEIASALFDLTAEHHNLGVAERRLLLLGAALHDVGRKVDDKRHPTIGARMILAGSSLPLTSSERRCIAYLTRYHRGAVPQIGYDDILSPSDGRKRMRAVLALLRAADALDSRQMKPPGLVFALAGKRLTINCYLDDATIKSRRFFKRRKKFRLLEDVLGIRVDLAATHVDKLTSVA